MNIEYAIVRYVQIVDAILVAILPWLRWLAVVTLGVSVSLLDRWNVKRPRPPN